MSSTQIRLYNTLLHQKVPLTPISPGKIGLYVCGPTVYSFIHIGNARTFTSFDVVVRYLRWRGFDVTYVRNFTDVDDKIIKAALETNEPPVELAARFVREFEVDAKGLGLLTPDVSPKVSEHMPEIIDLISRLVAKGAAYESQGDVYFSVSAFSTYGQLSRKKLDELQEGTRSLAGGEALKDLKRAPADFALWKAAKPNEPAWDSPFGRGRPGWHIECSAMSAKYLGETFDLHGGGLDLIFPHHENEIAQSEAASGKTLCTCWMHSNFLDLEGAKMSKSLGNVVRLRDALAQVDGETLRYFFLSTHYRQQLAFSDRMLADAEMRLEYFYETLQKVDERIAGKAFEAGPIHGDPTAQLGAFDEQLADDFNFTGGLGVVAGLFAELNLLCASPPVKDKAVVGRTLVALRGVVEQVGQVLGLFQSAPAAWLLRRRERLVRQRGIDVSQVEALLRQRQTARAAKDFATSDSVRSTLTGLGVEVKDTPAGQVWKVNSQLSHA